MLVHSVCGSSAGAGVSVRFLFCCVCAVWVFGPCGWACAHQEHGVAIRYQDRHLVLGGAAVGDVLHVIAFTADDTASTMGGGKFKGDRGTFGSGGADIFRVHEQELNTDVTIDATENALASGPLTVASGITLTVTTGGNLSIV